MQKNLRTRFALGTLAADARSAAAVVLLSFGLALMLTPGARAVLVQSGGHWPRSDRAAAKMVHRSSWEPRLTIIRRTTRSRRELSCTHFTPSV